MEFLNQINDLLTEHLGEFGPLIVAAGSIRISPMNRLPRSTWTTRPPPDSEAKCQCRSSSS